MHAKLRIQRFTLISSILLFGFAASQMAAAQTPTATSLNVTPGSAVAGGAVTMSVAVTASGGTPSGTMIFLDGAATLGTMSLSNTGSATWNVSQLTQGTHVFWAYYTGTASMAASGSPTITMNIAAAQTQAAIRATTTSLTVNPTAVTVGKSISFVSQVSGATSGSVRFLDGTRTLGTVPLSGGQAVLVKSLTQGTHTVSAKYIGVATATPSISAKIPVMVSAAPAPPPPLPPAPPPTAPAPPTPTAPPPTAPPTPTAPPPTVACSAVPTSINAGDVAALTMTATSPTNGPLTPHFTTTAGSLAVNGSSASLVSTPGVTGLVTITCGVMDSLGQTTTATTSVWVNAGAGEQALTAYNFTDSVGVNVHLHFGNTGYVTDFPDVLKSMVALGVKHYRNGIDPYAQPFEYANAEQLAAAGIKGDWLIDARDTLQNINAIIANAPNSVEAFEGPNEDDGDAGAVLSTFMDMLHSTVKGNPSTANVPVFAPTVTQLSSIAIQGSVAADVDFANMHDYYAPRNPETPAYGGSFYGCGGYGSMAFNVCMADVISPGRPVVSTETGYISGTQADVVYGRYIPRTLFAHLGQNVSRTYLYELLENVDSPGYGMLNGDFSPKPAYTAVQSLLTLFKDQSFTSPGKLQYTLSGQTTNVNHVLFQKSDGTYLLAIWLGVPSGNAVAPYQTYSIPTQTVTVTMQTSVGSATVTALDDYGNMSSQGVTTNASQTLIPVTDRVTIVSFNPRGK